jgi:acetyl-CoA carboxylase biotin carboxylase subunit
MADRVVCIGPAPSARSYLSVGTIVTAALGTGATAIHPGYGFLAEQPELAQACAENGLIFIGPKAEHIRTMGDKLAARKAVQELGVPVVPGSGLISDLRQVTPVAEEVGFPILLKAAAGGGGKGMKTVYRAEDLPTAYGEAAAEARSAFGDDRLYMESFIPNARHIEIQILGDQFGNMVHLLERDCSVQRRYQKLVEEAPARVVSSEVRNQLCQAALRIAESIQYENAGTIEFILDQDKGQFYFLEMNTRIQVEHPVTEMITGVDLVLEQIRVANGDAISFSQQQVSATGHAIECRINAELPDADFRPSPGRITHWSPPEGAGIRVDTHCFAGYTVPPFYDSLLAKLIVIGDTRMEAIKRLQHALANFQVSGIDTTIPFLSSLVERGDFIAGHLNTRWLEDVVQAKGDNQV